VAPCDSGRACSTTHTTVGCLRQYEKWPTSRDPRAGEPGPEAAPQVRGGHGIADSCAAPRGDPAWTRDGDNWTDHVQAAAPCPTRPHWVSWRSRGELDDTRWLPGRHATPAHRCADVARIARHSYCFLSGASTANLRSPEFPRNRYCRSALSSVARAETIALGRHRAGGAGQHSYRLLLIIGAVRPLHAGPSIRSLVVGSSRLLNGFHASPLAQRPLRDTRSDPSGGKPSTLNR